MNNTFTITVTSTDGSNQYVETRTFDIDSELRKTPNLRQALCSHFISMTKESLAEVDPSIFP